MAVQRVYRGPRARNREARPAGAAGGPLPRPARTGNLVPGARTADMLRARMSEYGGGYGQQQPGPPPGVPPGVPPGGPLSTDGRFWWDGQRWRLVATRPPASAASEAHPPGPGLQQPPAAVATPEPPPAPPAVYPSPAAAPPGIPQVPPAGAPTPASPAPFSGDPDWQARLSGQAAPGPPAPPGPREWQGPAP